MIIFSRNKFLRDFLVRANGTFIFLHFYHEISVKYQVLFHKTLALDFIDILFIIDKKFPHWHLILKVHLK